MTNRAVPSQYRLNLDIPKVNPVSFGNKSIRYFRPKIWNSLPPHIKSCENLETFTRVIKNWDGIICNCRVCKVYVSIFYVPAFFLRVLRAFVFCMAYVSSFSYVPYVPSSFLHALHTLIFSSALSAFIFDVHDVPSLFLSVSNF